MRKTLKCPICSFPNENGDRIVEDLTKRNKALTVVVGELREVLGHYVDTCITCGSLKAEHDENGLVDMMDAIGKMVCGHPEYPAQALFDKFNNKDNSKRK